jgi:glycosyltransferase involved in cell wall biosynthesis
MDTKADLVLVGPKGWNEDITALIEPLGDRVKPLGFVPAGDLGPLYAGAAVFTFPSFAEGFGFPVIEAMAQGTPVVTSRGTSTEEIGGDAVVLIDPTDPGTIAAGLARVLDDESFAADLGARGKERAAHYTWDRTAALLGEVYQELTKKG